MVSLMRTSVCWLMRYGTRWRLPPNGFSLSCDVIVSFMVCFVLVELCALQSRPCWWLGEFRNCGDCCFFTGEPINECSVCFVCAPLCRAEAVNHSKFCHLLIACSKYENLIFICEVWRGDNFHILISYWLVAVWRAHYTKNIAPRNNYFHFFLPIDFLNNFRVVFLGSRVQCRFAV